MKKTILLLTLFFSTHLYATENINRYFLSGDGTVQITNEKTGQGGKVQYLLKPQEINRIFGVPANSSESISLRLISLLDYLQEHLKGGMIHIVSGYRSPSYNEGLRKKGRLAAKTSMHIEGMAADINMDGVDGKTLWEYVRSLNCCGAGYYHGKGIHVDVGNSRFWDETSTKVDQDIGGHNKLLLLRTDFDRYLPGETMTISISRVTDYPIGIKSEILIQENGKTKERINPFNTKKCQLLSNRVATKNIHWKIPEDFKRQGRLTLKIETCDKVVPEMIDEMISNEFEVKE